MLEKSIKYYNSILHFFPFDLTELIYNFVKKNHLDSNKNSKYIMTSFTEDLIQFRNKQYLKSSQYLLNSEHSKRCNENEIDKRSAHLIYEQNNEINGALRLTPFPFEMCEVLPKHQKVLNNYSDYIEIGRLISNDKKKTKDFLIYAGIRSFFKYKNTKGFIALVPIKFERKYKWFGFTRCSDILTIDYRNNGQYLIMKSDYSTMGILTFIKLFIL